MTNMPRRVLYSVCFDKFSGFMCATCKKTEMGRWGTKKKWDCPFLSNLIHNIFALHLESSVRFPLLSRFSHVTHFVDPFCWPWKFPHYNVTLKVFGFHPDKLLRRKTFASLHLDIFSDFHLRCWVRLTSGKIASGIDCV